MACRTVTQWLTSNILVPVTQFLTAAREACEEVGRWVEENVERPIEQTVAEVQETCNGWPWPLNWVCSLVTLIVTIIVWIVVTVVKWVVVIACQIVTHIIGIIVTFVLQVVSWVISFVVCLFTDPGAAFASFRDLWTIILDTIGRVFDLVDALVADIEGILTDVEELFDSIATVFGWLGVILGIIKGILGWVREIVSAIRDVFRGIKDLYLGLLSGNLCRIIRGVLDAVSGVVRALFSLGFGFGPWAIIRVAGAAIGGIRDAVEQHQLEDMIRARLASVFSTEPARVHRAIKAIGLDVRPMGLRFDIDARRMFIDSDSATLSAKSLHDAGTINLWRLAGYWSDCGKLNNEPDAEVVYAGTDVRVTARDIETYLASGPGSVPRFRIYAITRAKFRTHLEMAQRKMQFLGVRLLYVLGEVEATLSDHVPLNVHAGDATTPADDRAQQALFTAMTGRDASGLGLATIPAVSHFHYIRFGGREPFGLASWFRPDRNQAFVSGVTYRNLTPDWGLRFVLAHELGHYLGLDHRNRARDERGLDEIMYSPDSGVRINWTTPFEYLLMSGEPRFTADDALTTWEWITSPVVRDILLP